MCQKTCDEGFESLISGFVAGGARNGAPGNGANYTTAGGYTPIPDQQSMGGIGPSDVYIDCCGETVPVCAHTWTFSSLQTPLADALLVAYDLCGHIRMSHMHFAAIVHDIFLFKCECTPIVSSSCLHTPKCDACHYMSWRTRVAVYRQHAYMHINCVSVYPTNLTDPIPWFPSMNPSRIPWNEKNTAA